MKRWARIQRENGVKVIDFEKDDDEEFEAANQAGSPKNMEINKVQNQISDVLKPKLRTGETLP